MPRPAYDGYNGHYHGHSVITSVYAKNWLNTANKNVSQLLHTKNLKIAVGSNKQDNDVCTEFLSCC